MNTKGFLMNSLAEKFWSKVDKSGDCWEWTAGKSLGYGYFYIADRNYMAHRVAYELAVGPIPTGLHIDHLCRNEGCVNPKHLEAVTPSENVIRGAGFGGVNKRKTHCIKGHKFTKENTYISKPHAHAKKGQRYCRTCWADRRKTVKYKNYQRQWWEKQKPKTAI